MHWEQVSLIEAVKRPWLNAGSGTQRQTLLVLVVPEWAAKTAPRTGMSL